MFYRLYYGMHNSENVAICRYFLSFLKGRYQGLTVGEMDSFESMVTAVLLSLNDDEQFVLIGEFVKNLPSDWYLEYFSKSTYYRIRKRAITNFLRCLRSGSML